MLIGYSYFVISNLHILISLNLHMYIFHTTNTYINSTERHIIKNNIYFLLSSLPFVYISRNRFYAYTSVCRKYVYDKCMCIYTLKYMYNFKFTQIESYYAHLLFT